MGMGVGVEVGIDVGTDTGIGSGAGSEEHATPKESANASNSIGRSFTTL